MLLIILLIFGLVFAFRIPGLVRAQPSDYGNPDFGLFETWKKKELWSIYIFLLATWGQAALFFCIGLALGVTMRNSPSLNDLITILSIVELAVFFGGLIWAGVLGSQATKLKKQMQSAPPPSYYPRPGAQVLHNEGGNEPTRAPDRSFEQPPGQQG